MAITTENPVVNELKKASDCMVSLECFLDVVRALGMGHCLTVGNGDGTANSSVSFTVLSTSATTVATIGGGGGGGGGEKRRKKNHGLLRRNSSSIELKRDDFLRRIPGRMFFNCVSDVSGLFTKQGKKGVNQDAMIVWENFGSRPDTIFCGVFDGHGPFGHMVAKRVRDILPVKLSTQWALSSGSNDEHGDISGNGTGTMRTGQESADNKFDGYHALKDSFLKAFKVMDKELKYHPSIDCFYSGTTAVTLVKQGDDIVLGNVGDSRAVLGTRDEHNSLVAVQLTEDLKPNLPREEERIRKCNGRVFALPNEPEVARVWLPKSNSPGLAMARAFGDFCLKDNGLIVVPEIYHHHITDKDAFVVLATDGIWDVLSNEDVVNIVASAPRSSAARLLVETAARAWRYKYPTSKVDDCTVACLYLDSNSYHSHSSNSILEEQAVKNT